MTFDCQYLKRTALHSQSELSARACVAHTIILSKHSRQSWTICITCPVYTIYISLILNCIRKLSQICLRGFNENSHHLSYILDYVRLHFQPPYKHMSAYYARLHHLNHNPQSSPPPHPRPTCSVCTYAHVCTR